DRGADPLPDAAGDGDRAPGDPAPGAAGPGPERRVERLAVPAVPARVRVRAERPLGDAAGAALEAADVVLGVGRGIGGPAALPASAGVGSPHGLQRDPARGRGRRRARHAEPPRAPERLNAYTLTMGRELSEAFAACDADDAVRAIIVTGAGRAFCAGADLARGGETFDRTAAAEYQGVPPERPWEKPAYAIAPWDVRKPIIAAINGPAVGVGATLPMQWDIRLAAESAKIGFVFVRRGVVPEALSTWIMPRLVGMARAAELLLTGRIVDARE